VAGCRESATLSGAGEGHWDKQALPSVFKHTLLDKYVPQFAGMTGSRTVRKRVIFLDGFAGRGRYEDGRPGSAERIMKMSQVQHQRVGLAWSCWFVEKDKASAAALGAVVSEFLLNFSMDAVRRIGGQAAGHNPDPATLARMDETVDGAWGAIPLHGRVLRRGCADLDVAVRQRWLLLARQPGR